MECVRRRVKDVDFAFQHITVRQGKGAQDRVTMLPQALPEPLRHHLAVEIILGKHLRILAAYAGARAAPVRRRRTPR